MRYDAAVFDFDGTVVDTISLIIASYQTALATVDRPPAAEAFIRERIGLPLRRILAELGPGADVDAMEDAYRANFRAGLTTTTRPYDGMPDLLGALRAADMTLAVATSRRMDSLQRLLAAHELAPHFAFLASGSCVEQPKPHPEMLHRVLDAIGVTPERALMVGDSEHDVAMGRAAGVDTCAVTWGAGLADTLRAAGPTYVVDDPEEIYSLR